MKGFFGIVDFESLGFEKSKTRFLGQFSTDQGYSKFDSPGFFLFSLHERFPIVSLTKFSNLVFAGWSRLDNRKELCDALDLDDTVSEAQLILEGFLKWEEDLPKHLIGDFSFSIWDKNQQTLFLAKDHLGVRPLYYLFHKGLFYFSTSIPWIKNAVGKKLPLNERVIGSQLKYYYQDVEETFFRDIIRLKPAHFLTLDFTKKIQEIKYWNLEKKDLSFCKKEEDYIQLLRGILEEAIRCRINSKKTAGTELSGGLDSSAITVLLSRMMDKRSLHTYSFVLDEVTKAFSINGIDEKETQRTILDYANLEPKNHHQIQKFHFKDVFEELRKRNEVIGGAEVDNGIWQDSLLQAAKQNGVEVMFSGFLGDEGISDNGNRMIFEYLGDKNWLRVFLYFLKFRRGVYGTIKNYYKGKKCGSYIPDYHQVQDLRNLLHPDFEKKLSLIDHTFPFREKFKELMKARLFSTYTHLRMEFESAYANFYGIEMAYPLADIRLLEVVYSLPIHLFEPKPFTRAVFRKVCEGILPDEVRLQKKNNGAYTLAFWDYLCEKKHQDFLSYQVKNHLGMMISADEFLKKEAECENCQKDRLNVMKEIDYLIDLNWPPENDY